MFFQKELKRTRSTSVACIGGGICRTLERDGDSGGLKHWRRDSYSGDTTRRSDTAGFSSIWLDRRIIGLSENKRGESECEGGRKHF